MRGFGRFFGCFVYSFFMTKRKTRESYEPTENLQMLFEESKRELNIKSNVKLTCHFGISTPSLMFNRVFMPLEICTG